MKTPRNRPAVTMCDNEIYVIGGYADCQSSVETFNVVRKTWHDRAPMNSWRFGIGIAELDGYIFAVGGGYGSEHIDIVERYHRKQDMWTAVIQLIVLYVWHILLFSLICPIFRIDGIVSRKVVFQIVCTR